MHNVPNSRPKIVPHSVDPTKEVHHSNPIENISEEDTISHPATSTTSLATYEQMQQKEKEAKQNIEMLIDLSSSNKASTIEKSQTPANLRDLQQTAEQNLHFFSILKERYPSKLDPWNFSTVPTREQLCSDLQRINENTLNEKEVEELKNQHTVLLEELLRELLSNLPQEERLSFYPYVVKMLLSSTTKEKECTYTSYNDANIFHYAAAIGDLSSITEAAKFIQDPSRKELNDTSRSGSKSGMTPLLLAITNNQKDAAQLLIELGADVNKKVRSIPLLHSAIMNENLEMVQLLTEQKNIDLLAVDGHKRTALHAALDMDPPCKEIIEYLQGVFEFQSVHTTLNDIYGRTIEQLESEKGIDISQEKIIDKLIEYLKIHDRNLEVIDSEGMCNGLGFLAQYYTAMGRKEGFYKALQAIVSWDGSEESLKEKEKTKVLAENLGWRECADFGDFMEQWTNDIVWFMHLYHYEGRVWPSAVQPKREEQFQIIKSTDNPCTIMMLEKPSIHDYTKEDLIAKIKMYHNSLKTVLEFGGSGHKTSAQIVQAGQISYYDPNFSYEALPFDSIEELVDVIIDTKYRELGTAVDSKFRLEFMAYRFENE